MRCTPFTRNAIRRKQAKVVSIQEHSAGKIEGGSGNEKEGIKKNEKVICTFRSAIRHFVWLRVIQEARRVPKVTRVDDVIRAQKLVPVRVEGLGQFEHIVQTDVIL